MGGHTDFECLNCRGARSTPMYAACRDHYLGKPFSVDYVRCDACGLVQQWPLPEDTAAFYEAYPVHARKSALHERVRRAIMAPAYFDASALAPGSVLLDMGCGDGWFLASLAERRLERVGFEPDAAHAERLSAELGVPVFSVADEMVEAYRGRCDAVTMHFVVEHLTELHVTFDRVAALLKAGGVFFFTVPNIDSWEARLFGRRWHNLDAPRHISFPGGRVAEDLLGAHGMALTSSAPRPFPNGVAGSIPVALTGRFRYPLFLLSLPLAVAACRIAPSGVTAFLAKKVGGE